MQQSGDDMARIDSFLIGLAFGVIGTVMAILIFAKTFG
jgi:hypothetical protein